MHGATELLYMVICVIVEPYPNKELYLNINGEVR